MSARAPAPGTSLAPEIAPKSAPWCAWAGGPLVATLTLVAFLPAIGNGFVNFDDAGNFLDNPFYRGLGWNQLRWMFTSAHKGHYIPVTWLTLGLDHVLWGMNPRGYHLTSLVLHAANATLFYVLALRLIGLALAPGAGRERREVSEPVEWALGATVAALLFSVHPLRVESVAWITERRDLVCGLFSLATVLAYVASYRRGGSRRLDVGWYLGAVGFFVLALLSKSIVVGLPLVLLALDFYPLRRLSRPPPRFTGQLGRLLLEKAPFLLLSAALTVSMLVLGIRRELMTTLETLGIAERLAVSCYGLLFYLRQTLVPGPLSPFYELHYPILPLSAPYLGSALMVLSITLGLILARQRWPAGLTAWLAYVLLLLPVLGLVHNGMQIAADRYSYFACLGWALVAGGGVAWGAKAARSGVIDRRLGRLVIALAAAEIVALGALTVPQIRVWRDSDALWRHALAVDPSSAQAHYFLGGVLWTAGRADEARSELEQALALLPDRLANAKAVFHASLGLLLQQQGDLAGAEQHYSKALMFSEDNVLARNNLGVIYALRGDPRAALDSFLHLLRAVPGHQSACANARRLAAALGIEPVELKSCAPSGDTGR